MQKQKDCDQYPQLKIIKASAGSGKTFRLTGDYLKLIFTTEDAYKHVLAVTFTNKATEEMKSRIVSSLAKLADSSLNPSDSAYFQEIVEATQLPPEKIQQRAQRELQKLLHDYSSFNITTIDRFFVQTMRAFAYELGVGGGYSVELDQNTVLEMAIDAIFASLEQPQNKKLLKWLIQFAQERLEEGKVWDLRKEIFKLAKEIFKENYKIHTANQQQNGDDFRGSIQQYRAEMLKIKNSFENTLKQYAKELKNLIESSQIALVDFKYGRNSGMLIVNTWAETGNIGLPSQRVWNLIDNNENWYAKTAPDELKTKMDALYPVANTLLKKIYTHITTHEKEYNSATQILQQYFTLGILTDIVQKVQEYCRENNLVLLTSTTEMLNQIIGETETPFIYEKIGSFITHYMIDEFQDTSLMQWRNFKPLIDNSLSSSGKNLLVGDVKQSIYRWRNSDWKLLSEQVDKEFANKNIEHQLLNTNWRSAKEVVWCNNAIFRASATVLQQYYNEQLPEDELTLNVFRNKITTAYSQIEQKLPTASPKEGAVSIQFLSPTEGFTYEEEVLQRIPLLVENLQQQGYALRDIAFLVRQKSEGIAVANTLLQYKSEHPNSPYKYDIISDEALLISKAEQVKAVTALLAYLNSPEDTTQKAIALYWLRRINTPTSHPEQEYLNRASQFTEAEQIQLNNITTLPLYEMVEALFAMLHPLQPQRENIFVQAFLDLVLEYVKKQMADLNSFLVWWDERKDKECIFTPENQNAIRIITIHKSKGLEFNVVVIPFCDWQIDSMPNETLWCIPTEPPFNQLSPIPLAYKSALASTIFSSEYYEEKIHAYIDNLNIQYVAFTRAQKELHVFAPKPLENKKKSIKNISSLLWYSLQTINKHEHQFSFSEYWNEETGTFFMGSAKPVTTQQQQPSSTENPSMFIKSIPFDHRVLLRLSSQNVFEKHNTQRVYGTLMHKIISHLDTPESLEKTLQMHLQQGEIEEADYPQIKETFDKLFSLEEVIYWYSPHWKVKNEIDIILPNGKKARPDRVMIDGKTAVVVDYKFGKHTSERYTKQIKTYLHYLQKMGFDTLKGYVCYVQSLQIEEVTI